MSSMVLATMPDKIQYAQALATASLLPRAYQKQPANVLVAIEYGEALGIPPMQAINSVHVIEGKPSASADLLASLVRRAGHKLRIREEETSDGPAVTATIIRADDPDFEFVARWDRTKARAAKLLGKGNWATYEGQMMRNRAITEVCRQGASDALYGVIHDPEELGADSVTIAQSSPPTNAPADGGADALAQIGEQLITPEQTTMIATLMGEAGLAKTEMLAFAIDAVGHPLTSASDLTTTEADAVISALAELIAAEKAAAATQPAEQDELIDPTTGEIHDAELVDPAQTPGDPWAGQETTR